MKLIDGIKAYLKENKFTYGGLLLFFSFFIYIGVKEGFLWISYFFIGLLIIIIGEVIYEGKKWIKRENEK